MQKVSRFFIAHYELEQIARKSKSKMISNNQKQNGTHVGKQYLATKISLLFFFGILVSCNTPKEREELFVIKSGH
jgi:transketolase N-terminal domain/subunit